MQNLAASFLDFLCPPLCLSCSSLLANRNDYLCSSCLSEIRRIDRSSPEFEKIRSGICTDGIIDDLVAPFWFDKRSPLQSVIHALKYQQVPQVGWYLGEFLGSVVEARDIRVSAVIPVPLHAAKLREREYNQAECIARAASDRLSIPCLTHVVRRSVNTPTQTELTAAERQRNVDGAFVLASPVPKEMSGGPIMLVDDVLTTGATIRSVASLLHQKGLTAVFAGTVAVAAREHL